VGKIYVVNSFHEAVLPPDAVRYASCLQLFRQGMKVACRESRRIHVYVLLFSPSQCGEHQSNFAIQLACVLNNVFLSPAVVSMVAVYNTFGDAEASRPKTAYKKYLASLGAAWVTLVVAAVLIVGEEKLTAICFPVQAIVIHPSFSMLAYTRLAMRIILSCGSRICRKSKCAGIAVEETVKLMFISRVCTGSDNTQETVLAFKPYEPEVNVFKDFDAE
jgi:hypothetical protein